MEYTLRMISLFGVNENYGQAQPGATLLDEICATYENEVPLEPDDGMLTNEIKKEILDADIFLNNPDMCPGPTLNSLFDGDDLFDLSDAYFRSERKWGGCGKDCAKKHAAHILYDEPLIDHVLCPKDVFPVEYKQVPVKIEQEIPPYTPDSDHCYSAKKVECIKEEKLDDFQQQILTPPSSNTESSGFTDTSEDEVDVVTVPEEYQPPAVPKSAPRRNTRAQRGPKKTQQTRITAKSLKAAMKRTRITACRKTYNKRQKINSVETSPFSSAPSSDGEESGKRANHNTSERKRREIQRTNLQLLRVCIPELVNNPKAPKVLILNSATTLVKKLEQSRDTILKKKSKLAQEKSNLTARLNLLRMQLKM